MSSTILAHMKETAQALIDGFDAWDLEAVMAPRAENCIHTLLPKSLGVPNRTNQEFREAFGAVMPLYKNFKFNIDHAIYDAGERKAAFSLTGSAETPLGDFNNEYAFFLTFTSDGTKVSKIEEMVDSAHAREYFQRLSQYMKTAGK